MKNRATASRQTRTGILSLMNRKAAVTELKEARHPGRFGSSTLSEQLLEWEVFPEGQLNLRIKCSAAEFCT